jgi:signal peptidase I
MEPTNTIEKANPNSISYLGSSMNPGLKPRDRLQVIPYNGKKVRRGDVIVFVPPGGESKIVHRVVSIDSEGIKTRGDNNYLLDQWILRPEQIYGRVVSVKRGKRKRIIFGGLMGQLFHSIVRALNLCKSSVSAILHPSYDRLAKSGIFRRCLPVQMRPRVISLNRAAGTELQLHLGRRVIGNWLPGHKGWHIRRPFRLFVDETSLPENKEEVSGFPPEADQVSGTDKAEDSGFRFQVSGTNEDM